MGKVQANFTNLYPGAISRSVDDVVISMVNVVRTAIAFGAPVFLDATNKGAVNADADPAMTTFLGFATRIGVKTPNAYDSNVATYNPGDVMSIIVRGSVCVPVASGTPAIGGKVYITSAGTISATSTSNTELTNCKFRSTVSASGVAEIVITERNIQ